MVMKSSWHFSTSRFKIRFLMTPKQDEIKLVTKCSSDYIFDMLRIYLVLNIFKNVCGALKDILYQMLSYVDPCMLT